MQASTRILVNTIAQYIRTILNLILSLYSARLVLDFLGVNDFGIYSLVAGVVSMLSFLTNSLVGSTQRFLSISQGKGDLNYLKKVFSNSLLLHLILGFFVLLVLESLYPLFFNGFLNIPQSRLHAAVVVYQMVVLMVYISLICSPYRALLVSRENIVYISILDVLDGVLKVLFVLLLPLIPFDSLVAYGLVMLIIRFLNLLAFAIYTHLNYAECIFPRLVYWDNNYVRELMSYTGWGIYSSACIALRLQGLAIVLNHMLGTAINAAYGIGSQIAGMVSFVSSSFNSALAPQLMAAEGGGNRDRMMLLAKVESKISFLLLAMIGIPTMFEMDALLHLWLKEVPEYTVMLGCMFLSMQIIDMLTSGLGTANRAMGKIGLYTFLTFTPKLLALPLCWLVLQLHMPLYTICIIMVVIEGTCMLLRLPLLHMDGFNRWTYFKQVILKSMPPVIVSCFFCLLVVDFTEFSFRFLLTFAVGGISFAITAYCISLNESERTKISSLVASLRRK